MFRTIRSIVILLLIGIVATGMPIYSSNINVGGFIPNISLSKDIIYVTAEQNIVSPNHSQIVLGFSTDSNSSYSNFFFDETNPFTIELSSNNNTISNLSLDDLISSGGYTAMEFYSEDDIRFITFEFEQEKLNLPDGSYKLKIIPNIKDKEIDIEQSEFTIDFNTKGTYLGAGLDIKNWETGLTLYFPDNEFNYLIPVTRPVRSNAYPLTTTVRNLEQGPSKDLGIPIGSFVPMGSSAGRVGNTAHIRLPGNIGEFEQGSTGATIAIDSFVRSLTSLDGISKVQFYLTGQYANDPFHGLDITEPFNKLDEPEIYTAYISDTDRFLLSPVPFSSFGTQFLDINIETVFKLMKFMPMYEIYNSKRHPLVPSHIDLLEYSIDDGLLTLIFNEEFARAYENNPERHDMMVDGIVLTFMSMEDIDSLNIKMRPSSEDSGGQLINYDFNVPIYINLEQ